MGEADDQDLVSVYIEYFKSLKFPFIVLWVPAFIFLIWSEFTSSLLISFFKWIFLILAFIVSALWSVSLPKIETSSAYRIVKKRDIPEERKEEINVDWHKFSNGNSRWQKFIETKVDHYNFSSPVNSLIDGMLYNAHYSQKTVSSLRSDITVDRLEKNQTLYLYFIDDYYDEFERKREEKTLATLEPEIDEAIVERRRKSLEDFLAKDKVEREADKEYLRDVLRKAKGLHREYVANKKAIGRLDMPDEEKKEFERKLEERYEDARKEEEEEEEEESEEEKEGRWKR